MGKWNDFIQGYGLGQKMVGDYNESKKKQEMKSLSEEKETQAYTADQGAELEAMANAKDADGNPYYTVGNDATGKYTVTPNFQNETGAAPTDYTPSTVAAKGVSYLGKNFDAPLSDTQRNGAQSQAMAGVMEKYGDAEGAMRYRQQAQQGILMGKQLEQADMQLAQSKRTGVREEKVEADALALRTAMAGGIGVGLFNGQAPGRAGEQLATTSKQSPQGDDLHSYLSNVAPGVVKTLLSQGKVDDAKRFNDFVGSEQGKTYATAWTSGLRKHAMGDHAGAIRSFEKLYNDQLFDDGQTVKIDPIEGGKQYQVRMFDAKGNAVGSQTLDPADLAGKAALMLEPTKAVEFIAQQTGKRDAEKATLDRQVQLEGLRQETTNIREDHRDNRLAMRLQAAPQRGGLTATQQRSNFEIDDAREQVSSMDANEIRRRTAKQTDTGRENPDYDPTLARAANLAGRRKVGEDQTFDARRGGAGQQAPVQQAPAQGVDRQDVAKRFRSDKTMNSHRLGKDTPGGVEVLDKSGKVIGHYR